MNILSFLVSTMVFFSFFVVGTACTTVPKQVGGDFYARRHIVQLTSQVTSGSCTGFRVRAPSGHVFTLTAQHCGSLISPDGQIVATDTRGVSVLLRPVALSETSDLLLLTGGGATQGLSVSSTLRQHERVHTIAHGAGKPAYRLDGEVICWTRVNLAQLPVCDSTRRQPSGAGFFTTTSMLVLMGASGGPLLNTGGQVVGVNAMRDHLGFSYHVSLRDIKLILAGR